jgi:hypothetical protein
MITNTIDVPEIGSKIVVELATMGSNMIPPCSDTIQFEGEVLPSYKWLTDREFCLTGDDQMPIRVINLAKVRKITFRTGGAKTLNTSTKTFTIMGSKGDKYLVTRNPAGWSCTCKGFEFRKSCRHITEAQNKG